MVSNCWKRLELQPTTDLVAIKRAYREQVKRYHPDTVMTPEQKRRYTIICAAINEAYREAVRWARAASAAAADAGHDGFAHTDRQDTGEFATTTSESESVSSLHQPNAPAAFFKWPAALRTLLLLFLGFEIVIFFTGPVNMPGTVETVAGVLVALFVGLFIYGVLVAGALDLLIVWLFPRRLLDRLGLAKYESKLIWLLILAANGSVFFLTKLIAHPGRQRTVEVLLDITVRAAATLTVPAGVALFWLRDLVRYRRIKQAGIALAESL